MALISLVFFAKVGIIYKCKVAIDFFYLHVRIFADDEIIEMAYGETGYGQA
jgi:hypothetical protein